MKLTNVLKKLKTNKKVASLGFNRSELRSIAQQICDNSELEDDATEEEENTYIEESITDTLPILQLGQKYANRIASDKDGNAGKKSNEDDDDEDNADNDDDDDESNHRVKPKSKKPKSDDGSNDGEPSWFKKYRESMDQRFEKIESSRTGDTRKSKVEKILKDAGVLDKPLGKRTLRDFGRMHFENDEEFDEFIDEIAEDVEGIESDGNDDDAVASTSKDITPPKGGKKTKKNDVASDQEVDDLAGMF
jgi:hypothetical protein